MRSNSLQLELKGLTESEFEVELVNVWRKLQLELASDPRLANRLEESGIPPSEIAGKPITSLIWVERGAVGFTGLETVVINVATGIVLKLFERFILPELTRGKQREAIQAAGTPNDDRV